MLKGISIGAVCLGAVFVGLWMSTQSEETNARSLWTNSAPGAGDKNLAAYNRVSGQRRFFGWAGLALGVIGIVCAIARFVR